MADIALAWNAADGSADLVLANGDLVLDQGLLTAVIVSLQTDRLAEADDELPDNSNDRRGWVGDAPLDADADVTIYFIGSRLWLLSRAKQTTDTLRRAENYALQALQWMIDDGVAGQVTAVATYPYDGWMNLQIGIYQAGGSSSFNLAWQYS